MSLCLLKNAKDRYKLVPTQELHLVVKVESSLLKGARRYLEDYNFIEVVAPHLTKVTGACENVATMFQLEYFGQNTI